jgi:hypothetical protein
MIAILQGLGIVWVALLVATVLTPFPRKWNVLGCFVATSLFLVAGFLTMDFGA